MAAEHSQTLETRWQVEGRIEDVSDILGDVERLPEWWGEVYLSVEIVEPGDEDGLGRVVDFHTRGWLPYTLRWRGRVVEVNRPHGWVLVAEGDLNGRGIWRLAQKGDTVEAAFDWTVEVGKPGLGFFAPVLGPVFAANHSWAMARGLEGLRRELARRRAAPADRGEAGMP